MRQTKALFCALLSLALCLAALSALGELDVEMLEQLEGTVLQTEGVNTVIRSQNQPYIGSLNQEHTELCTFLDLVELPDMGDAVLLRLTLSLETWDPLGADEITVTVGRKNYAFRVFPRTSEYDMTYYEDYELYVTEPALPMIKTMSEGKADSFMLTFLSRGHEITGWMEVDLSDVRRIYKAFVSAGGLKQALQGLEDAWPCDVESVK